jgi:hypothetical protein
MCGLELNIWACYFINLCNSCSISRASPYKKLPRNKVMKEGKEDLESSTNNSVLEVPTLSECAVIFSLSHETNILEHTNLIS